MELELSEYSDEGLDIIYSYYENDFPINERKSYLKLKELLSSERYRVIVAKREDSPEIKAYALVLPLFEYRAVWIDYIAVLQSVRGEGIGSRFLTALKEYFKDRADILFAEVEQEVSIDINERKLQESRIRFYKTNGGLRIDLKYELPTLSGGMPMYLYYISAKEGNQPDIKQTKKCVAYLFKYVHNDIKDTPDIYKRIFGEQLVYEDENK